MHCTALCSTSLNCTKINCTSALHFTALHCTSLHCTKQRFTTLYKVNRGKCAGLTLLCRVFNAQYIYSTVFSSDLCKRFENWMSCNLLLWGCRKLQKDGNYGAGSQTNPPKSAWQKCGPMELLAFGLELNLPAFLLVRFAWDRKKMLLLLVGDDAFLQIYSFCKSGLRGLSL